MDRLTIVNNSVPSVNTVNGKGNPPAGRVVETEILFPCPLSLHYQDSVLFMTTMSVDE